MLMKFCEKAVLEFCGNAMRGTSDGFARASQLEDGFARASQLGDGFARASQLEDGFARASQL